MRLDAYEVALEIIRAVRDSVSRIQQHDRDLALQLRRAASSMALNVKEASRRAGKDRAYHFRVAAGSAAESQAALEVACAWGYVGTKETVFALDLLDRELAMLYRLATGTARRGEPSRAR